MGVGLVQRRTPLHAECLGDWDGRPPATVISKLVEQSISSKALKTARGWSKMSPFGLGRNAAKSSFLKSLQDVALVGGLRVQTLLAGSFLGALVLWGVRIR